MNRDDITRLAKMSGVWNPELTGKIFRFARLIEAHEREECAKVVEQAGIDGYGTLASALLIRKRGQE